MRPTNSFPSQTSVTILTVNSLYRRHKLAIYPDRAELKREYPELEDEDIRQALAFAAALVDDRMLSRLLEMVPNR